jgi:hypothetical protein
MLRIYDGYIPAVLPIFCTQIFCPSDRRLYSLQVVVWNRGLESKPMGLLGQYSQ